MKRFNEEEDQFIEDHYLSLSGCEIGRILGRPKGSVRQRMKLLGFIVPPEIKQQFTESSFFRKGKEPFNKGVAQRLWMSKESIQKIRSTQYKKGNLPHNTLQDFSVAKRKDKSGITYLYIRVKLSKWVPLHRYVWEQANGLVLKDHNIVFKDRNSLNCNLDNLEMLSNAELLNRNSAHRFGPEIFKIIQLRGALNRQINKRLKQLK